jgi:hypothetical protein
MELWDTNNEASLYREQRSNSKNNVSLIFEGGRSETNKTQLERIEEQDDNESDNEEEKVNNEEK